MLRHIASCAECAQTYRQIEKMEHAARALYANAAPSPLFVSRVEERLALLPTTTPSTRRTLSVRPPKKDNKMQRISFAVAVCAACSVAFFGLREKNTPAASAADVLQKMRTALSQSKTEHVTTYAIEVENGKTHKVTPFGRLVKLEEWWNAGDARRVETPDYPALVQWAAKSGSGKTVPRFKEIWAHGTQWQFDPHTGKTYKYKQKTPQNPMGWKNYALEQIAGDDNLGLRESTVTDAGTRSENGRTLRTIIVERKAWNDGPRWVCQIDADTNLPVQLDDTNVRNGKWISTGRYLFEWNRPLPTRLFDPALLPTDAPAPFVSPDPPADAALPVPDPPVPAAATPPSAPVPPVPTERHIPPQVKTEHLCYYSLQETDAERKSGKLPSSGKLIKREEWWTSKTMMRKEVPYGGGDPKKWRTLYRHTGEWQYSPETKQVEHFPGEPPAQIPLNLKGYALNQLAGDDNLSLRESTVSDGGTRTISGRSIHTIIVKRNRWNDGPVWICQMDAKTNLPIRVEDTNKRNGKWVTTLRYEFEFNRPLPASLFNPNGLQKAPPANLTFPSTVSSQPDQAAAIPPQTVHVEPKNPALSAQTLLAPFQTAHLCLYNSEKGGETDTPLGTLTKVEEWWKSGPTLRQETPFYHDLLTLAGKAVVPDKRHWRTLYGPQAMWQYSPETYRVQRFESDVLGPQPLMGLKGFGLEHIAGDDATGLKNSTITDGGMRTERGRSIHTIFVKRNAGNDGLVWMCQMDAKTNLPLCVETTYQRGGKWITTTRYDFEFNRPLPPSLFDPKALQNAPPADFTFPATR